jgi:hypothetical protein
MAQAAQDVLTFIRQSPAAVAAHERQAWLDLFADDAIVEDPVGSTAVRKGDGTLAGFWDTFIASSQIRLEILADYVDGDDAMRDVVMHTQLARGVELHVPAYLLYETRAQGGGRRLARMAGHWTIRHSGRQSRSLRALRPMATLFVRMLRHLGPAWMKAYLASQSSGVGLRGVRGAEALATAVSARDTAALAELFVPTAEIRSGAGRTSPAAWLASLPAGSRLSVEAPIAAGWVTACRFRLEGPAPSHGLALLTTSPTERRLLGVRFFPASIS